MKRSDGGGIQKGQPKWIRIPHYFPVRDGWVYASIRWIGGKREVVDMAYERDAPAHTVKDAAVIAEWHARGGRKEMIVQEWNRTLRDAYIKEVRQRMASSGIAITGRVHVRTRTIRDWRQING